MESRVWAFICKETLIREGQKVGAAVSGGADSMALLLCLRNLSKRYGFELQALHVEHGIRGAASREDASFVRRRCEELGVFLRMERADVPSLARSAHIGLEQAGRQVRASFFERLVQTKELDVVATAHHREDNAESVLLHALRGCGLEGLTGIEPRRGFLIRPFLCLSKKDILRFLDERGEVFREDETNADTRFARNFLRQVIVPQLEDRLNPRVCEGLDRLSACVRSDADYLRQQAALASEELLRETAEGICMSANELMDLHPALQVRVVQTALAKLGRTQDVEHVHLQDILMLARTGRTGAGLDLGGRVQVRRRYDELVFCLERPRTTGMEGRQVHWGKNVLANGDELYIDDVCECGLGTAYREYMDADKLPAEMIVRSRRPGDIFHPLHGPGKRKLKEYFIDRKLPREERDAVPLLVHKNRILWAVGQVISEDVCVDASTKRICRLTYVPVEEA